jgi:MinD-like ATPase involved in chromosome partitioning or flagellar assembly
VDLPTYTNIWRIEKRLYKLYDLRLPMPLPLGQIVAFAGITVPYVLFLTLIGMPFNHNLFWLYVLPPWALTWLATRPVLENKRLPELLISQVRYLGEPRVWCRMSPPDEKDEITVTGRVWHARRQPVLEPAAQTAPARTLVPLRVQTRSAGPQWAAAAAPVAASAAAGAPARRRAEPRHRKGAAPQLAPRLATQPVPAAAPTMAVQAPARGAGNGGTRNGGARNGADAPVAPVQWARRGPSQPLNTRAISHESRPRDRAAATARRPAAPVARPPAQHARPGAPSARPPAAAAPPVPTRPARRPARPPAAATPPEGAQRPGWATRARPGQLAGWPVIPPGPGSLEVAHAENGQPVKRAAAKPGWEPKRPGWDTKRPAAGGFPGTPARNGRNGTGANGTGSPAAGARAPGPAVPEHVVERGPAPRPIHGTEPARPAQPAPASFVPPVPPVGDAPPPGSAQPAPAPPTPAQPLSHVEAALAPPAPLAGQAPPASQAPPVVPEPAQPAVQPPPPGLLTPIAAADRAQPAPAAPASSGPPAGHPPSVAPPAEPSPPGPAHAEPSGPPTDHARFMPPAPPAPAQARHAGPARPAAPAGPPGPYRPPQPAAHRDQEERDQARARLPLPGPRRIVIIGCTSGAGQTVTALLTARLLASIRTEPVGALDLNPGEGSLAQRLNGTPAGTVHDLLGGTLPVPPVQGVEVISADGPGQHDFDRIGEQLAARYRISLIDPGASGVGPALGIADQLVLVAPASGDAPRAVSMTRNWLDSHGHHDLAAHAVMVLNGVSSRSLPHVEEAEAIVVGRCRTIVRVPWEDALGAGTSPGTGPTPLRRQARQAITELAGVLVSGLAAGPGDER